MKILSGDEHFTYNGVDIENTVCDFWAWQSSDLLNNTTRGILAEYLVASALKVNLSEARDPWNDYDILYNDIKIEVKSSAYLQSWNNEKLSKITFTIYPSRPSYATSCDDSNICRHSNIYVFCLFNCKDKKIANPMQLEQWKFYVLDTLTINKVLGNQRTISLSSLLKLPIKECNYDNLKDIIDSLNT